MSDKDLPAFSIALFDGNQVVWAQVFGYQDPEHKIPATAHTIYRVCSVSKLFTDILIMQILEARKINMDTSCKPIYSGFSSVESVPNSYYFKRIYVPPFWIAARAACMQLL